jgi:ABC-type sugar transport system substrate-binding protein
MKQETPKSAVPVRRKKPVGPMLAIIGALTLAMLISACGGSSGSSSSSAGGESSGSEESSSGGGGELTKITVVLKDGSAPYWLKAKAGAEEAAKKYAGKAEIDITNGNSEADIESEIQKVENAINSGAEGIVIAPDSEQLQPVLTQALSEGVKVATIDSPEALKGEAPFIGTNNVEAGEKAFEAVSEAIGGKGEVGVIGGAPGIRSVEERVEGFNNKVEGSGIEVASELGTKECDQASGVKAAENMITSNPNLAAIFAGCGDPAAGAAQAIKGAGKVGKIQLIGFDASEGEIPNIESELEYGSIAQFPNKDAEVGVEIVYNQIHGEEPAEEVTYIPTELITKENVSEVK